jgi:hypothetical protein
VLLERFAVNEEMKFVKSVAAGFGDSSALLMDTYFASDSDQYFDLPHSGATTGE